MQAVLIFVYKLICNGFLKEVFEFLTEMILNSYVPVWQFFLV